MEETIEFVKNDTVRAIEKLISDVKMWQVDKGVSNPYMNPREAALVVTKLEEARLWAFLMVKRD